ncbi:holin-like protein [compost metagenome]
MPAAVGLMEEGAILSRYGLGIVVAVVVSTLLTLVVTALVFRAVAGRDEPDSDTEGAS